MHTLVNLGVYIHPQKNSMAITTQSYLHHLSTGGVAIGPLSRF